MPKKVHQNSRWSYENRPDREREVLRAYRTLGDSTDREIAEHLGYVDMNSVRPFITNLVQAGDLREVGSATCHVTGRTVRVCKVIARS